MARKLIRNIIVFDNEIIQALYEDFIKNKLLNMGYPDYDNIYKFRKGIGDSKYGRWRLQFLKQKIYPSRNLRLTGRIK